MYFSSIVIALTGASTALAAALPGRSTLMDRQVGLCTGASTSALCCATDVLGVADLDCAARMFLGLKPRIQLLTDCTAPTTPTDPDDFEAVCAAIGQRARCCLLPIVS
jgi:hypothetical protein